MSLGINLIFTLLIRVEMKFLIGKTIKGSFDVKIGNDHIPPTYP